MIECVVVALKQGLSETLQSTGKAKHQSVCSQRVDVTQEVLDLMIHLLVQQSRGGIVLGRSNNITPWSGVKDSHYTCFISLAESKTVTSNFLHIFVTHRLLSSMLIQIGE